MKITEVLFEKSYTGVYQCIPIADIPKEFLTPENDIMIHVEEGYYDDNGWMGGSTIVKITHTREQTPEEKEETRKFFAEKRAQYKKERYELYLTLKKDFEND